MALIKVLYFIEVGKTQFIKMIGVYYVPSVGSLLRISDYSFIVYKHEQNLDANEDGTSETIHAKLNPKLHKKDLISEISDALLADSWRPLCSPGFLRDKD